MLGEMGWFGVEDMGTEPVPLVAHEERKIIMINDSGLEALVWDAGAHAYFLVSLRRPTKKECAVFVWNCPYGYQDASALRHDSYSRVCCNYRHVSKAEGLRAIAAGDGAPSQSWLPEQQR